MCKSFVVVVVSLDVDRVGFVLVCGACVAAGRRRALFLHGVFAFVFLLLRSRSSKTNFVAGSPAKSRWTSTLMRRAVKKACSFNLWCLGTRRGHKFALFSCCSQAPAFDCWSCLAHPQLPPPLRQQAISAQNTRDPPARAIIWWLPKVRCHGTPYSTTVTVKGRCDTNFIIVTWGLCAQTKHPLKLLLLRVKSDVCQVERCMMLFRVKRALPWRWRRLRSLLKKTFRIKRSTSLFARLIFRAFAAARLVALLFTFGREVPMGIGRRGLVLQPPWIFKISAKRLFSWFRAGKKFHHFWSPQKIIRKIHPGKNPSDAHGHACSPYSTSPVFILGGFAGVRNAVLADCFCCWVRAAGKARHTVAL